MPNGFMTGAVLTARHRLMAASPFKIVEAPPPQAAWVPAKLDRWGNDQYGDCVTAEEAFKCACENPEIFIDAPTVVAWARRHGYLNGANLPDVMNDMRNDGFKIGGQQYNCGPYAGVNYADEAISYAAMAKGPLKIAIDHAALPSGAGNIMGWYAVGGRHQNQDHCVSWCGYGRADFLAEQLRVQVPSVFSPSTPLSLVYTWKTIGFVDFPWIGGTCAEAWLRSPNTVGVPPLPGPAPEVPIDWSQV